jgi:hypothetical protein
LVEDSVVEAPIAGELRELALALFVPVIVATPPLAAAVVVEERIEDEAFKTEDVDRGIKDGFRLV